LKVFDRQIAGDGQPTQGHACWVQAAFGRQQDELAFEEPIESRQNFHVATACMRGMHGMRGCAMESLFWAASEW
jgi:hypothetical protein